jgi:hypothetical protein
MTNQDLSRLHELAVSDSGFALDPRTGHTFTLNETGLAVLRLLKEGLAPERIVEQIETGFEIDPGENVRRDVDDFIVNLRGLGLVR